MRKPKSTVVVGGVDLYDRFGLALVGCTLEPPEPKAYSVDVPGGDGALDLTEAIAGDVAFSNRRMTFDFASVLPDSFEAVKTQVSNFLHGRRMDFELGDDPGYTYTGRFSVSEYYGLMHHGHIEVTVDADPYKLRERKVVRAAAGGGARIVLECGRRRQIPTVECETECVVAYRGRTSRVQPGSWKLRDLWLEQGDNEVFVVSELGRGDRPMSDYAGTPMSSYAHLPMASLMWVEEPPDVEATAVYFSYDIEDL